MANLWELDTEIAAALAPVIAQLSGVTPPPVGDVATRRAMVRQLMSASLATLPAADAETADHVVEARDGHAIPVRLYTPAGARSERLAVYIHGGGMILGSVDLYDPLLRFLADRSGTALLAVDYRLAPEHPHPTPVEDCYAALAWAAAHAAELGASPDHIGVAGDSAGGGLAAAVALLARDRGGPALSGQVLIYPMLDDRNVVAPSAGPALLLWSYDDNATGWGALLGDAAGGPDVPAYAAPARAETLDGLPATYLMVGGLDIFLDEDLEYARRLTHAGVSTELHLHPGAPHAFDFLVPGTSIAQRALDDEVRVLQRL